ncbi:CGNR zinc finger domain-containing protein [Fulvivirgaceae bacterium BMA10]|uniref:CGNR zinc finger domain-containing protein n=1 Tax=Splendidivirga corallicola TaxID=3051826 RepID=A0ABT8KNV8_9BACT|nr:CGNR zinc finger domain-containing protein [Fulvivirgaceae bacterium BMA10]
MRPYVRTIENVELDGGHLSIDFINTVRNRFEEPQHDYLQTSADLLKWCRRLDLLSEKTLSEVESNIASQPAQAEKQIKKVKDLREVLYEIFVSIAYNRVPKRNAVQRFNYHLAETWSNFILDIREAKQVVPEWSHEHPEILQCMDPIVKAAYELLMSSELLKLKECGACGWLFLDKSKNQSRRWCNMQTCGSSEKARNYYKKTKTKNS